MGAEQLDQLAAHPVSLSPCAASPLTSYASRCLCQLPAARCPLFFSAPGLLRKILRDIELDWENLQKWL